MKKLLTYLRVSLLILLVITTSVVQSEAGGFIPVERARDNGPVADVFPLAVHQMLVPGNEFTSLISIKNSGDAELTYTVSFEIDQDTRNEDWLVVTPLAGSVAVAATENLQLVFDAEGLEVGHYHAVLTLTTNDPSNVEIEIPVLMQVNGAMQPNIVVLQEAYTFPIQISPNGKHVLGSQFGGQSYYYWSEETGVLTFSGDANGLSNEGIVSGAFDSEFTYNGNPVKVPGTWDPSTQEWTFLGMNPAVPEFNSNSYGVGYGISADGSVMAGMQNYTVANVRAFRWTEEFGYEMIGVNEQIPSNNRPNGISADGTIIYGWAQTTVSRSPVFWKNDELFLIAPSTPGEARGASFNSNYVVGEMTPNGFIWSEEKGLTVFTNSLNNGRISSTSVLDDGTIFGFTAEGFPPLPPGRRAFVRYPGGAMSTFNVYAVNRGWLEAENWLFYSINDVSPDGNRFIGAALDKNGNPVSFMIDFNPDMPAIEVDPVALDLELDWQGSTQEMILISNVGTGELKYNAVIQYIDAEAKVQQVPVGPTVTQHLMQIESVASRGEVAPQVRGDGNEVVLNYDGPNADNIGLIAGGTFRGVARFPSQMVAPFNGYKLEAVDVYIGALPTEISLKIWDAGTSTTPGNVLYEQVFVPQQDSWNTVVLNDELLLTGADVWVGFKITHPAGVYVLGMDGGPYVLDGNWLSDDGIEWEHLSDYGLSGNWNIRARLEYQGVKWLSLDPASGTVQEEGSQEMMVAVSAGDLAAGNYSAQLRIHSNDAENELLLIPVELLVNAKPMYILSLDVNLAEGGAVAGEGQFEEGEQVTVYATPAEGFIFLRWTDEQGVEVSSDTQYSFSMPAMDLTLTANFQSTVSVADVSAPQLVIYPNPAKDQLFVKLHEGIARVELIDLTGRVMVREEVDGSEIMLNVTELSTGIYLLKVTHADQQFSISRVSITR